MVSRKSIIVGLALVVLVPLLGLAWWLGSPLFLNTSVEEEFPVARAGSQETALVSTPTSAAVAEEAMSTTAPPVEAPMVEAEATESAGVGTAPRDDTMESDPMASGDEAAEAMEAMPEPEAPAEPVALRGGTFRDADSFHRGSGQATIYQLPDGTRLLRLENFNVTNGPDLHVYLSAHPDPTSSEQVREGGYIDLGALKGNSGNQNYEIPADVDVNAQWSVVIYCQPFHVVFSVAPLSDAG
jgi:hypothetical protein